MKKIIHSIFFFFSLFFFLFVEGEVLSQTVSDSIKTAPVDSAAKGTSAPAEKLPPSTTSDKHSVISLEYVKEKVEHSPDSTFFNILKITNNNGKPVEGVVRISVPSGWKLISEEETKVNISPGNTAYIPIRVSLARTATGGVSYLINATLVSTRSLFSDKNQTSVSKSCYVIIPKYTRWEIMPMQRTVYFNRYTEYASMQLKFSNKGNGPEVVKLDLDIGSSLILYGALGNKYFSSVELKPHRDTILNFSVKYLPADESNVFAPHDFKRFTIRVAASTDTLVKRTSVNFKYLESIYYNELPDKVTPLTIEAQLHNLLSSAPPNLLFAAYGNIFLKNYDMIDYNFRLSSIPIGRFKGTEDFMNFLWKQSRMMARYKSNKWEASIGDIGSLGGGFFGGFGRGIGGKYNINKTNSIGGTVTESVVGSIFSANLFQETVFPKGIPFGSSISYILDDYNKVNVIGTSVRASYSFLPGHRITLMLGGTLTQHKYDNQTFLDPTGNSYITTNDPGLSYYGYGAQLGYQMNQKKVSANINASVGSKYFSQYYNGQWNVNGTGQYFITKKYFIIARTNFHLSDPVIYSRGILMPRNKYFSGTHRIEFADRINSKLLFMIGPNLEHISSERLKVNYSTMDSTRTRFSSISPMLTSRLNYKNRLSGHISPYVMMGYTFINYALDSTIVKRDSLLRSSFFNARAGISIVQNNWGVNAFYYYGPHDFSSQSDYYYFGGFSKSIRVMPYIQKYFFNKKLLLNSYNSYQYEVLSNTERIALNGKLTYFFDKGWTLFVDNNMYIFSRISAEGGRVFSKSFNMSIGFRKAFDIPQPGVKYYDLKVICFKDLNGNGKLDEDEHGLSDIVISIDRVGKQDSATGKSTRMMGQFSPAELVTDNYGQIIYYKIPEGECNLTVVPLVNFKDVFNIKGQKQKVFISRDTTYYIPFVQSYKAIGRIILNRDEFSSSGVVSVANIRITARDSAGNTYPALSTKDGSYTLYVPQAGEYKISINNVFGEQFVLQESEYTVIFDGAKEFNVDFIFNEKKRAMNINGPALNPTGQAPVPTPSVAITPPPAADSSALKPPVQLPVGATQGVTYRIQIASSPSRIPKAQWAKTFKGVNDVREYNEGGVYKYTAGDFKTFEYDKATDYKEQLKTMGYKDAFIAFFSNGKRVK